MNKRGHWIERLQVRHFVLVFLEGDPDWYLQRDMMEFLRRFIGTVHWDCVYRTLADMVADGDINRITVKGDYKYSAKGDKSHA